MNNQKSELTQKERKKSRKRLIPFAKKMRNEPTKAEAKFWELVKNRKLNGMKFRR